MAMQSCNDIRVGWVINHNGRRWSVTSIMKVKPGKGGAFMQTELRDIDSGAKGAERFRSEDKVEKLMVEDLKCQY
ncbi:MAG: elongation factor P, partial [Alphaproteobacteria bacterium]|nr:elongation factor P [Alphaproteobacteria bacterium]